MRLRRKEKKGGRDAFDPNEIGLSLQVILTVLFPHASACLPKCAAFSRDIGISAVHAVASWCPRNDRIRKITTL